MEFNGHKKCVINTGNILSLNEITKKSLNPTEELIEAINITVNEFKANNCIPIQNGKLVLCRTNDDLKAKMGDQSLSDLKIGFKIFLKADNKVFVQEAIEEGFDTLKVPFVQSVVVQYRKDQIMEAGDDVNRIKKIWGVLEEYVRNEKIGQIGLADVEEGTFKDVFEWAVIKPSIIQINLATCCAVSPTLQAFCKENDVQLLTHSDRNEVLPNCTLDESLGIPLPIKWITRFLVHIKCRGVLCSKGYLIGLGD